MRATIAVLVIAFAAVASGRATAAESTFADVICPEATQSVVAVGKLRRDDPPQKIYDAAQAAVDAYERCSKDKLANGFREPQHYADVRAGGLAVVAARSLIALNRVEDARRLLQHWRPLVQQVVDWQSETETSQTAFGRAGSDTDTVGKNSAMGSSTSSTKGGNHRPSVYRDSAREIVLATDVELAKIGDTANPAKPQAQASPGH